MTATVLSETETVPASWPAMPAGLFDAVLGEGGHELGLGVFYAKQVPPEAIWPRIEDWIAWRWGAREAVWVVEGPGDWTPRLKPATVTATERWNGGAWESVTIEPAPLGLWLAPHTYRITATVGDPDTPPPAVQEAYRRLAHFIGDAWDETGGVTSTEDGGGFAHQKPAQWLARSLQYSGAADMLRRYRT